MVVHASISAFYCIFKGVNGSLNIVDRSTICKTGEECQK